MKRAAILAVVALAVLPVLATGTSVAATTAPAYYPSGPQTNVDESALVGWTQCWSGTYADTPSLSSVLDACAGDYLLLAAGPADSSVYDVVAAAPRDDVLATTTGNTTHDANGVGWYFAPHSYRTFWGSWGFAKAGDPIDRVPCDVMGSSREAGPNGDLRLCWNLVDDNVDTGWRSGTNTDLNGSPDFRRAVYVPAADSTPPTVTCSAAPATLWPPNHKLRDVTVTVDVTDHESGPAGFTLVGVTSNEADNGLGSGDTAGDVQGWASGQADTTGQLRAERAGSGTGRTYTLTYEGADRAGNTARCDVQVTVPKNA
jgi:hypothetical protein